ncbi:hypothetical protein IMZ38_00895 [Thermosphaera chiliense]|uniref:Uncharacterized protein n=1 Tax=Thermosphaera chiliense TaxID=3402707 RepID=A0A7M1UR61_9CREN|nr:hypothetical protein [Thermosphaera aggregans]QOR94536.1 hypothetical protein IMZ38_00895 [Thermosphaera aggregans]
MLEKYGKKTIDINTDKVVNEYFETLQVGLLEPVKRVKQIPVATVYGG